MGIMIYIMRRRMPRKNGSFIAIIPIIIILGLLVFLLIQKFGFKLPINLPLPSLSPTPVVTVTPSPSPKVTPTKIPTPKPTSAPVSGPPGAGYSTINVATEKGNFSVSVLSVDLNSARMITDTGNDGDCGNDCVVMPLADYVAKNGGFAGVNGTYFCPPDYPICAGKVNTFDFSVYNSRLGKWINQGMLSWGARAMVYFDGGGAHYLQNANSFGGGLGAGIVNYPGLLDNGNVQIDDNHSGLADNQKTKGTRVGIGVRNPKSIMIVIARNASMQDSAYIFKALGATGALNLDDGGSTALYYNGRYMAGPGRNLPNAIIFAK